VARLAEDAVAAEERPARGVVLGAVPGLALLDRAADQGGQLVIRQLLVSRRADQARAAE
jgi:hypothetical protein